MKIETRGIIYDATHQPDAEKIAFFPSLYRTRRGTLFAGFHVGPSKLAVTSTIRVHRSRDAGATWADTGWRCATTWQGAAGCVTPVEFLEPEPGRLRAIVTWWDRRDPKRPLFDPVTEGILHSRTLWADSTDDGATWSPWQELKLEGTGDCSMSLTGPLLRWPDGTIALPFESHKCFDDLRPGHHAAWLAVSRDGGRRFAPAVEVGIHPQHQIYYWDQRLCVAGNDGEYVALFWTHDLANKRDLAVHFKRGSIHESSSAGILPTTIPGQIAAPHQFADGRLLALVVDRGQPATIKLWVSHDAGATWPAAEALVVHHHDEKALVTQAQTNIDFKKFWEDMGKWSFGHPVIHALDNEHVLLAYYAGAPDRMSVHWAKLRV